MITKAQRKVIKKVLGTCYISKITKHVEELQVVNGRGNPHQDRYISKIFRQERQDTVVENAIFDLVDQITKEREEEAIRRQEIIDNAKKHIHV